VLDCAQSTHPACRRHSTSWLGPGSRGQSGWDHHTCSRWPGERRQRNRHGSLLRSRHAEHQLHDPFQGWGSCGRGGRRYHSCSNVRSCRLRSGAELGSQPGRVQDPGSGSTAWLSLCQFFVPSLYSLRSSRKDAKACGDVLSVVRGCGHPFDSWPGCLPVQRLVRSRKWCSSGVLQL
jgi:hypothetical protein